MEILIVLGIMVMVVIISIVIISVIHLLVEMQFNDRTVNLLRWLNKKRIDYSIERYYEHQVLEIKFRGKRIKYFYLTSEKNGTTLKDNTVNDAKFLIKNELKKYKYIDDVDRLKKGKQIQMYTYTLKEIKDFCDNYTIKMFINETLGKVILEIEGYEKYKWSGFQSIKYGNDFKNLVEEYFFIDYNITEKVIYTKISLEDRGKVFDNIKLAIEEKQQFEKSQDARRFELRTMLNEKYIVKLKDVEEYNFKTEGYWEVQEIDKNIKIPYSMTYSIQEIERKKND